MANKRMFSKAVVELDHFYDMPHSAQLLYFYLGLYADDDGFVSPKRILKSNDFKDDDLKILITKNFAIPFESGVIVITHWKENNYIQSDRYKPTIYQKEKKQLTLTDNGFYTMDTKCIQDVSKVEAQIRLDKIRLDKNKKPKKDKSNIFISFEKLFLYAYNVCYDSKRTKITGKEKHVINRLKEHGFKKNIEAIVRLSLQDKSYWSYTFSPNQYFRTRDRNGNEVDYIEDFANLPANKEDIQNLMSVIGKGFKEKFSDELEKIKEFTNNKK